MTLVSNNKIMLKYFKSNEVYLSRSNQQKATVFLFSPCVQLVVEQNSIKNTV